MTIPSAKESAMGECRNAKLQCWTLRNSFERSPLLSPNSVNELTFWTTPAFHTGTSTSLLGNLSKPTEYTIEPPIQSNIWESYKQRAVLKPYPTLQSSTQSILYEPKPTETAKTLQGIPFRDITYNNKPSTKTKIKSLN
jgi:hypothetical protein